MISLGLKSLNMLQGGQQHEVIFIATDWKERTQMKVIGDVMETSITALRQSLPSNSRLVSSSSQAVSEKENTMLVHDKQFNLFTYIVVTAPVQNFIWGQMRKGGRQLICKFRYQDKLLEKTDRAHFLSLFFLLQDQSNE